ncbi:hypothetical protein KPH14_012187 [Odynerus spinipes]|uniref:Reverse transcriptase Ty1/copia-type domain-containing protein n=1 Tax=Odynerus spinipes TaxID=1348599 RepID=A0AAD9RET7_9HYME|nr:hypothetical protein KPH14_012187 [Odynerus spinipes]
MAAQYKLTVKHLDVTTAYLNSDLEEDVYVEPPEELQSEAPKVYVDDLLVLSSNNDLELEFKTELSKRIEVKDMGEAKEFLGIQIERNKSADEVYIQQNKYIINMLEKFKMSDCKPVATPADPNVKFTEVGNENETDNLADKELYLEAIGSLLYVSQVTRPDIAFIVNKLSSFCKEPKQQHWNAVKRVFRYLKGSVDFRLKYKRVSDQKIIGYSDSDWANDTRDRKSITGCIFLMNEGPISWYSKKQKTVALSTVEAEYIALSFTCQEAMWLRSLTKEIIEKGDQIIELVCDNNGSIINARNNSINQRTKHIDLRHHFIRERIENKEINVRHIGTEENIADLFTKALARPQYECLINKITKL